jgi:hypothetical protein
MLLVKTYSTKRRRKQSSLTDHIHSVMRVQYNLLYVNKKLVTKFVQQVGENRRSFLVAEGGRSRGRYVELCSSSDLVYSAALALVRHEHPLERAHHHQQPPRAPRRVGAELLLLGPASRHVVGRVALVVEVLPETVHPLLLLLGVAEEAGVVAERRGPPAPSVPSERRRGGEAAADGGQPHGRGGARRRRAAGQVQQRGEGEVVVVVNLLLLLRRRHGLGRRGIDAALDDGIFRLFVSEDHAFFCCFVDRVAMGGVCKQPATSV